MKRFMSLQNKPLFSAAARMRACDAITEAQLILMGDNKLPHAHLY